MWKMSDKFLPKKPLEQISEISLTNSSFWNSNAQKNEKWGEQSSFGNPKTIIVKFQWHIPPSGALMPRKVKNEWHNPPLETLMSIIAYFNDAFFLKKPQHNQDFKMKTQSSKWNPKLLLSGLWHNPSCKTLIQAKYAALMSKKVKNEWLNLTSESLRP